MTEAVSAEIAYGLIGLALLPIPFLLIMKIIRDLIN